MQADPFGWVGASIDGKYRIDEVVGEGGFGVVYRGYHLGLREAVAIKCLKFPGGMSGPEREKFGAGFIEEGRILHRLSRASASIVQALDVGTAVSPTGVWTPYLALEWLRGVSLDRDLQDRRARGEAGRSLSEAIALLAPAAKALDIAHLQGVAHRDVKPANLFLADVGGLRSLKVLDFGIAKVMSTLTSTTQALADTDTSLQAFTSQYGAPEQFHSRFGATGPWTDVFALALVLIEVVSGQPALRGSNVMQLYIAATDPANRPSLDSAGEPVSAAVEAVIQRAVAVEPRDRYRTAGKFWDALEAALGEADAAPAYRFAPATRPVGGNDDRSFIEDRTEQLVQGQESLGESTGARRGMGAWGQASAPSLVIEEGPLQGQMLVLESGRTYVLGRDPRADLQLPDDDPKVSRSHALIEVTFGAIIARDLRSKNGIFVNEQRVITAVLQAGDRLRIGHTSLRVSIPGHKAPADPDTPALTEEDNDAAIEGRTAGRADKALKLLGNVADKALALGRVDEAELILVRSLADISAKVRDTGRLEPDLALHAAQYALRLASATGKSAWVDYVFEIYAACRRLLPVSIVDELYRVIPKIEMMDMAQFRAYAAVVHQQSGAYNAGERFIQQRIEGLERLAR